MWRLRACSPLVLGVLVLQSPAYQQMSWYGGQNVPIVFVDASG